MFGSDPAVHFVACQDGIDDLRAGLGRDVGILVPLVRALAVEKDMPPALLREAVQHLCVGLGRRILRWIPVAFEAAKPLED